MTERKFKLNFIDILILIVLAVAVGVLGYIFVFSDTTVVEGEKHTIEYVVEINSVNAEAFKDAVNVGDVVTLEEKRSTVLGTVTGVEKRDCYKAGYSNSEKKEVYTKDDDRIDIIVTFTAEAELDKWGYCVADETHLPVNTTIRLIIGNLSGSATVIKNTVLD